VCDKLKKKFVEIQQLLFLTSFFCSSFNQQGYIFTVYRNKYKSRGIIGNGRK